LDDKDAVKRNKKKLDVKRNYHKLYCVIKQEYLDVFLFLSVQLGNCFVKLRGRHAICG